MTADDAPPRAQPFDAPTGSQTVVRFRVGSAGDDHDVGTSNSFRAE